MESCNTRTKYIGVGLVKILILVEREKFDYWLAFFEKEVERYSNLQVLLAEKEKSIVYNLYELNKNNPFIFILDLAEESRTLEGYGSRYLGIFEEVLGGQEEVGSLDEEYARWFSAQTEFSVIKIGTEREDLMILVDKLLAYFNGK